MWGGVAISLALIMEDHHGFRSRPAVVATRDSPSHHHPARTLLALIFTTPSIDGAQTFKRCRQSCSELPPASAPIWKTAPRRPGSRIT
jgi:hypothetical protein